MGRREVLSGKAKFGIFGDGKELPQVVLSKFFKNGDFRAGYYRDQTILFSQEKLTLNNFFSALYANTDLKNGTNVWRKDKWVVILSHQVMIKMVIFMI